MHNIIIFSPSRFSLYTISVTELLMRSDVNIKAIYVKKLINPSRFLSEFRRDGCRLLRKIWNKGILRKKAYKNKKYETIASFMQNKNIPFKTIDELGSKYNIPIIYCNDLNEASVVENIKKTNPDIAVFTGGGLLRNDVLKHSGSGVLNCHMGVLPQYRGMDVIEWAILENNPQEVGMTVHFMDEGVDTGDLLKVKRVEIKANEDIKTIRDKFEPIMCQQIVDVCLGYMNGTIERISQNQNDGKQYYMMHPLLKRITESKLNYLQ